MFDPRKVKIHLTPSRSSHHHPQPPSEKKNVFLYLRNFTTSTKFWPLPREFVWTKWSINILLQNGQCQKLLQNVKISKQRSSQENKDKIIKTCRKLILCSCRLISSCKVPGVYLLADHSMSSTVLCVWCSICPKSGHGQGQWPTVKYHLWSYHSKLIQLWECTWRHFASLHAHQFFNHISPWTDSNAHVSVLPNIKYAVTSYIHSQSKIKFKRIFSDSNNNFLWHESEDVNKENTYFQTFSWFQFYIYKLCMILCIGIALFNET